MKAFSLIAVAFLLAIGLAGCGDKGSARTVSAYCGTVAKYRDRYLSAMDVATRGVD